MNVPLSKEKSRALKSVFRISRTSCTKTKKPKSAELNPSNGRTSPDFQEHSKLVRLPQNIICIITDPLDTISKARLIQTCRYLRATLEPSLYRTLNLDKKSTCNRADLVHRTLQERPDLIPYIHTYSGPLVRTNLAPLPTWRDRFGQRKRTITLSETEAFNMRMHVLCKTISIRDLDFSDYVDWASDPRWKPVRNAVFKMELTRLVYCFKGFSRGLLQVLRSQPSLEVLDLGWSTPELAGLKETDIPKLASLRAMLPEAIEIVPGRPIEKLHIIFGRGETRILEGVFHRLSLSTRAITELHLHFESRWSAHKTQDLLRVLSRNLPDVEELTIKFSGAVSGTVVSRPPLW
ncbi:hypothetical protein FRC04_002013 [Tulasnella sp. 424]|nr:hypothetical protein FRC04_002013 [Tulasnella sp. 424]KAG8968048.1 hypothetical protein FRC05_001681 [Tulasnella sp. 425]